MLVNFTVSDELSFVIKFGDRHIRFLPITGFCLTRREVLTKLLRRTGRRI